MAHFGRSVALLLALGLSACRDTRGSRARGGREIGYVSAEAAGVVAVLDLTPGAERVMATIPVGKRPRGVRLSTDGATLYVALSGSPRLGPGADESNAPPPDRSADGIGVVDLVASRLVRVLPSGNDPETFDLDAQGRIFVANEDAARLSIVDSASSRIAATVAVGGEPEGVTLRPGAREVFVTSEADGSVAVVDTSAARLLATIPVGPRPRVVLFSRDGARAYVSTEQGGGIVEVDAAKRAVARRVAIPAKGKPALPMGLALSPDERTLYVSTGRGGTVAVIDLEKGEVTSTVDGVGARPWGLACSADGRRLYTANGSSDDVSVIDAERGTVVARLPVPGSPWGIAVGSARGR